jgi:predicted dehydrogenase/threonine dehydrogenase-like Zn-dependent dehydrogenase
MKQVLQNFRTGELKVEDVPAPVVRSGFVLVRNHYSLISSGTEGSTVKLGQMSLLGKARARPEQVRKVLQVVRTEGWLTAYQAAMRSLDMPVALGYCCAGQVIKVGSGVNDIRVGDQVACGGAGYANHAEVVSVPRNLCVKVPDGVDLRHAAFTTLGSIAMQSARVADVRLGENVVVIGLGLVGLLAVQILQAAGCNVLGTDINPGRTQFASEQGFCQAARRDAANLHEKVMAFCGGYGADVIIITAAAPNNDPVVLAGELARYKGRVVVVGRTEMKAPRETYLFKELELCTSLAYGPGTGDRSYEEQGLDYPIGYVRWTENRNMAAFMQLVAERKVQLEPLITHEFDITDAPQAFQVITGQAGEPSIAVLLRYPQAETPISEPERIPLQPLAVRRGGRALDVVGVGVIGAGSFATNVMVPILAKVKKVELRGIASATGVRARALGKRYGFAYCAADAQEILNDPQTDCIFILTRHDTHAALTVAALEAGKHVFVEKPLAINEEELKLVEEAQRRTGLNVMVGFNRRYAPLALKLKEFFANRAQPMSIIYRANVGYRPPGHWLHDPVQGGGVIIGEACHFIDFCHWLVGAPPVEVSTYKLGGTEHGLIPEDNVHIVLNFADGSLATVAYLSNGSKAYSRERVEAHGESGSGMLEDFCLLKLVRGLGATKRERAILKQDKGYAGGVTQFLASVLGGQVTSVFNEQYISMLTTIKAANQVM